MSHILFVASVEREIGFFFVFVILPSVLTLLCVAFFTCLYLVLQAPQLRTGGFSFYIL